MVPDDFLAVLAAESFQDLDVTAEHAFAVGQLPQLHLDPFDRILIAQCVVENLTLVSAATPIFECFLRSSMESV